MPTRATPMMLLREQYPDVEPDLFEQAQDYYASAIITATPTGYTFPPTPAYPVGVTVNHGKCSCYDDVFDNDVEWVCAHLLAVELSTLSQESATTMDNQIPSPLMPPPALGDPHSINVFATDGDGFSWQITLRSSSTIADVDHLFACARYAKEKIMKYGWKPNKTGVQASVAAPVAHKDPGAVASQPERKSEALTFMCDTMGAIVNNGKSYWKIRGGPFAKFGVTVWEEVLEDAGFFKHKLDAMQTYNLKGWQAEYLLKEDGKPDKVTRLLKKES